MPLVGFVVIHRPNDKAVILFSPALKCVSAKRLDVVCCLAILLCQSGIS